MSRLERIIVGVILFLLGLFIVYLFMKASEYPLFKQQKEQNVTTIIHKGV